MTRTSRPPRRTTSLASTLRSRLVATLQSSEMDGVKMDELLIRLLITRAIRGDLGAVRTIFRIVDDMPRDVAAAPRDPETDAGPQQ